jgi:lipooligosaccharide transport system ATP-binding protein
MTSAVRARTLSKSYGDLVAVDGIDLDVPVGGCFGILGPNGAGKTTVMKMITCVSPPSGGDLEVLGLDVRGDHEEGWKNAPAVKRAIKRRLGVAPQGDTYDWELTVRENLLSFAWYHGLDRHVAAERTDELLDFVQLTDRAGDRGETLSGGMLRRLLIARALVNDPDLVVLDEPTTGLDPQARHLVWERLRSLRSQGKTLLVTTHYMDEAARLCDRLVIMDRGRIIAEGTPTELVIAHVAPRVVEVSSVNGTLSEVQTAVGTLADEVEQVGDRMLVYGRDGESIANRLRASALTHEALVLRDATLEDVFLRLTGRALVEGQS